MSVSVMIDASLSTVGQLPPQIVFTEPPPGMSTLTHFDIAALDNLGLMFTLRASDGPSTRLFAVSPRPYFPDYEPHIAGDARAGIGLEADDDALLLVIVNPTAEGLITANLLAPIAVNPATGAAAQVVLDDGDWPLRAPLGTEAAAS